MNCPICGKPLEITTKNGVEHVSCICWESELIKPAAKLISGLITNTAKIGSDLAETVVGINPNNCHGRCKKHKKQCEASIKEYDRNFISKAGFHNTPLKGKTLKHKHRCIECIREAWKTGELK